MRWNGRATRTAGDGQVMLESALSLIGVIMFLYVALKSWVWLTGILVNRQEAYNDSRLAAGRRETAGRPVRFVRPSLELLGDAAPAAGPRDGWAPPEPPCEAADDEYDRAQDMYDEAKALIEEAHEHQPAIERLGQDIKQLGHQIQHEDDDDDRERLVDQLHVKRAQLDAEVEAMEGTLERANELYDEAQGLLDAGDAAC